MSKVLTIYFDKDNSLLDQAKPWKIKQLNAYSEEAQDFDDVLTFRFIGGGPTERIYLWSQQTGRRYSMFTDRFNEAIWLKLFNNNQIVGRFRFEKRGQAQAIKLALTEQQVEEVKQIASNRWKLP